uniref:nuclear transport factor 2 family protein n=1 Tax=uncultured Draconibacterium sp. TaxID=1573823 RepID=UPI003216460C
MKNFVFVILLLILAPQVNAQTKNGVVYSEHETIDKTRALWTAFQNGDEDAFVSFFADSVYRFVNGNMLHVAKERFANNVKWWSENIENLKIEDAKPAYPDAIEYDKSGIWVQDWLRFRGMHTKTGINLNVHYHNLYSFNEDGKITSIHFYFDNDVFEEIANSQTTKENGKVYINHPYIVKVRKVLNAIAAKDIDTWASYFNPKARFRSMAMKSNESKSFEEVKASLVKRFENQGDMEFIQSGYPDCIYYAKNDMYAVYSWWDVKTEVDGKKIEYPIMFTHNFDKEGRIIGVYVYYSTNHMK